MAVRIIDVAVRAKVSSATVSRVLANKPYIRDEVRKRVRLAVEELGYQPNRVARTLRVQSSQIIGLIISDIQNPFFTSLVRAVEDQAYAHQYAVFLCNSDENIDKESLYIDLMMAERVAGVIIIPTRETASSIKKMHDAKMPLVTVDRQIRDLDLDTVAIDNVKAAHDIVAHLVDNGHRRIGAILASPEIKTGFDRFQGYLAALNERGIELDPTLVRTGLPIESLGRQSVDELFSLPSPPTALFTGNNLLTVGALHGIKNRGLKIPDDLSLVAFDDMEWYSVISPTITAIAQPTYDMGWAAADLILNRIRDPNRPINKILLQPEMFIRESVRKINDNKGGEGREI
jgi:DNA-binding LacI/PurR family transcriptional regulator